MSKHKPNTLQYMCEQHNMNWNTFVTRFYYLGWSLEKSLTEPTKIEKARVKREEAWKLYQSGKSKEFICDALFVDRGVLNSWIRRKRKELAECHLKK